MELWINSCVVKHKCRSNHMCACAGTSNDTKDSCKEFYAKSCKPTLSTSIIILLPIWKKNLEERKSIIYCFWISCTIGLRTKDESKYISLYTLPVLENRFLRLNSMLSKSLPTLWLGFKRQLFNISTQTIGAFSVIISRDQFYITFCSTYNWFICFGFILFYI